MEISVIKWNNSSKRLRNELEQWSYAGWEFTTDFNVRGEGRTGDFSLDDGKEGHTIKGQNKGRAGPSWEKEDMMHLRGKNHMELFKDSFKYGSERLKNCVNR